jgi:hypothetical protein
MIVCTDCPMVVPMDGFEPETKPIESDSFPKNLRLGAACRPWRSGEPRGVMAWS